MQKTVDANTAVAHVAYAYSEVAAIYPITPSSVMAELCDAWSGQGRENIFSQNLKVVQMQSEAGVAGAIHGSCASGSLTTTFTASQGLLLMIPVMYKLAGELLPTVFHVTARSLATHSLSIFGDHSDVMATRQTGFALLCSNSVQEAHDMAIVAHLASLESRVPFLHFFDGFRSSHEIQKADLASYTSLEELFAFEAYQNFQQLRLNPKKPFIKTGAQNPDVFFQSREAANPYYEALVPIVEKSFAKIAEKYQRSYQLFDYVGSPEAKYLIVAMGSAAETIEESVNYLCQQGHLLGLVKVRLYRPFSKRHFLQSIPKSCQKIAVLDRCKEPGALGEPLYLDVCTALYGSQIQIIAGRYGLSSKEFTPSMVKAVFDNLQGPCKNPFTVGIEDDVSNLSLKIKEQIDSEDEDTICCKFWGLGSDGTVGANKNAIKIIGENSDLFVQGYFEYDSKKSGGLTISHLRFGKKPIQSAYLLQKSDFIAVHNHSYIGKYNLLEGIKEGGCFLLNAPFSKEEAFNALDLSSQECIIQKKIKFYTIDAASIADSVGLGRKINTVMAVAFFKLSEVLEEDLAIKSLKKAIEESFSLKGPEIVQKNFDCIEKTLQALQQVPIPESIENSKEEIKILSDQSQFLEKVFIPCTKLKGNEIKVSEVPVDGAMPSGTSKFEKRSIAAKVPKWLPENCSQCGQCIVVCPHAAIRAKQIRPQDLQNAPENFATKDAYSKNTENLQYRLQVYPQDCTGCNNCVEICPIKGEKPLEMQALKESTEEIENASFFDQLPESSMEGLRPGSIKELSLRPHYFEFSGSCEGCGETPYVRMATQLFGKKMIIANATGCSSIYGGSFPSSPYTTDQKGCGPAWANSLFENNAEFGFGIRVAIDQKREQLQSLLKEIYQSSLNIESKKLLENTLSLFEEADEEKASLIETPLRKFLSDSENPRTKLALEQLDYLINPSVWLFGGDGWAYDIGFGGLDHVLASSLNINVLVLDTECYSNTGGQASKATPRAAVAKFAASGKEQKKKDLGIMIASQQNAYVASINLGANKAHALKAMLEAERYPGPALLIAYSPCIAHGIEMKKSPEEAKLATSSGYWPLYRFNPLEEKSLSWDSKEAQNSFEDFTSQEIRYRILSRSDAKKAQELQNLAQKDNALRFSQAQKL